MALLERALAACHEATERVVVGPRREGATWTQVLEDPPGSGPVAALAAGLRALRSEIDLTAVLAVDMPHLRPDTLRRLLRALIDTTGADGAVLVDADSRRHLALALRRTALAPLLADPAALVDAPLWRTLAPLTLVEVPAHHDEHLDVDTPEDLDRARATLTPPPH